VEEGFPVSVPFTAAGESLAAEVFAFKPEGAARDDQEEIDDSPRKRLGGLRGYRKREGIVFVRNGQTHGSLPKDFFRRDSLKMKPLAEDLLIFVDCDGLSDLIREDLFMPSRDRLTDNDFKRALVDNLEKAIRDCDPLKILRNRRQQERLSERFKDDRPLTDVLQSLIRSSPNLTHLLQLGQRISAPFNTVPAGSAEGAIFKGEIYPTYFKFKGLNYGAVYERECHINQRMRLTFETDARNDYFTRRIERGEFRLYWVEADNIEREASYVGPTLKNGIASVMLELPDGVDVGNTFAFIAVTQDSRGAYENRGKVTVAPEVEARRGAGGERKPPADREGRERERPNQVAPPRIERIYRDDWERHEFDEFTAMKAEAVGYAGENDSTEIYVFKVNMDNTPLLFEIKERRLDEGSARNQFLYGSVLVGLSLLLESKNRLKSPQNDDDGDIADKPVEERIERTCRALAPFMLALTSLGTAELSEGGDMDGFEEVG
jgi:hypothetical protein